jgi:hypothetical protein
MMVFVTALSRHNTESQMVTIVTVTMRNLGYLVLYRAAEMAVQWIYFSLNNHQINIFTTFVHGKLKVLIKFIIMSVKIHLICYGTHFVLLICLVLLGNESLFSFAISCKKKTIFCMFDIKSLFRFVKF